MSALQNPALAGFYADPSVVRVDDDYYLACSSFEYFPGIPLFHSTDAEHWQPISHVVTRPGQLAIEDVPTLGGAYAPTIRHHDGRFYLVVADNMGRGPLLFTAEEAAGPWSDGLPLTGVDGIDHDLAWDAQGNCLVTYSGLIMDGLDMVRHLGICQVRMDLATGRALEAPRSLWSGTGLKFPEAPHLYEIDGAWYLMIAEGGTERGHCVSIARGPGPEGPFEGAPSNPVYSHRSTSHPVQNAGHGDLVETDDGWRMVLLGTRPGGTTQVFAQLGRETWTTRLRWADGWPVIERLPSDPASPPLQRTTTFGRSLGSEWLSVRDARREWLRLDPVSATLSIEADADLRPSAHSNVPVAMDAVRPRFIGRRQQHLTTTMAVTVDPGEGVGGISVRYDERHHYDIETGMGIVCARVRLDQLEHTWEVPAPGGELELWIEAKPPTAGGFAPEAMSCDTVRLGFGTGDGRVEVAAMDGRYLTSDTATSFTGRVTGMYAAVGTVGFRRFEYRGHDA